MGRHQWIPSFVAVIALCGAQASQAGPIVIDQSTWGAGSGSTGIINDDTFPVQYREVGQTFSIANDGVLLGIELWLNAQRPEYAGTFLTAYIVPTFASQLPTDLSLALASISTPIGSSGAGGPVLLGGFAIPVAHGDLLGVVLTAALIPGGSTAFEVITSAADHAQGSLYVRTIGDIGVPPMTWSPSFSGRDLMFRTYVDCAEPSSCVGAEPIDVPETGTLLLLGFGVATITMTRRIRSTASQ